MDYRERTEQVLDRALQLPEAGSRRLVEAMRYSALGGGKRLRPTLVYVSGVALGASLEQLDDPAAAVELIHVYSLVHDDLPAMDDDDLRRGRPSCHRAFDEATAYDPHSPYSASKAASDHLVRAWHDTYGLPVIVTNCSNNYGPYQFPEKLLPLMINNQ